MNEIAEVELPALEYLSLRWCHITPAAAGGVLKFLSKCGEHVVLDVQGNRGLSRASLAGFSSLKGC